jgi:hypothetical protein
MMLFVVGIIIYSYFVSQLLWGIIAGIMILMLTRQFLPKEEMMIPKLRFQIMIRSTHLTSMQPEPRRSSAGDVSTTRSSPEGLRPCT